MNINLISVSQVKVIEYGLKAKLLQGVNSTCDRYLVSCISSVLTAPALAIISTASIVGTVFESVLKGVINCAGSSTNDNCNFIRGCRQLFIETGKNLLWFPIELVAATLESLALPCLLVLDPVRCSCDMIEYYTERKRKLELRMSFVDPNLDDLLTQGKGSSQYVAALRTLGTYYQEGRFVDPDQKKALIYFKEAASFGCLFSIVKIGDEYLSQNREKAIELFERAFLAGSRDAGKSLKRVLPSIQLDEEKIAQYQQMTSVVLEEMKTNSIKEMIDEYRAELAKGESALSKALEIYLTVLLDLYPEHRIDLNEFLRHQLNIIKNGLINQYDLIKMQIKDNRRLINGDRIEDDLVYL